MHKASQVSSSSTGGLRFLRFLRGLTQDDISRLSGIDPAVISRAERGVRISSRARAAIAAALGVREEEIFGEAPESSVPGLEGGR
jgi:transcriptional regulator with XRE-family HTH domain